jgi:phosphoribosylpyrophosphate synthetase
VRAVVTHLLLPPGSIERVEAAPLQRIIGTDTHPNHQLVTKRERWEVVSVAGVFGDAIGRLLA